MQANPKLQTLSTEEIERVAGAGGTIFGDPTVDPTRPGGLTISPTTGLSPLYVRLMGKWVPLGTEPFIGPAASEL
jgi:hypothetical protein